MKNKLILFIALCCIIPFCSLMTACGDKHKALSEWTTDASQHWHKCECSDDCSRIFNLGNHDFVDTSDKDTESTETTKGKDYKKCSICDYETYTEKDLLHIHTYENGICSCGEIESTFIKENDWNNLFIGEYLNNVTFEQNMYLYDGSNPNTPIRSETTRYSLCSEDAIMIRTSSNNVKTTIYHVNKNNSWFAVAMVNNQWYGIVETESESKAGSFQVGQGGYFINRYNDFSYIDNNGYGKCFYKYNIEIAGENCEYVKIYIEDGKLVKIERKINLSNGTQYVMNIIEFSNHGTTVVNAPDFTIAG